ncbi:hypothetical protein LTR15_002928 [Elasticomyces elasticus]|nr:hypothetical protein LTR15_002928 [Elasticomyces elasticus]
MSSLDTGNSVSMEISSILRFTQRRLKNLVFHYVLDEPPASLLRNADDLGEVTTLSFNLGSYHDTKRAAGVVRRAHAATSLSLLVSGEFYEEGMSFLSCTQTIFADWHAGYEKLKIRRLNCYEYDFEQCSDVVARALSPLHFRELTMDKCRNTNFFLRELHEAKFTLTEMSNDRTIHDIEPETEMQDYLRSYSGLRSLRVTTASESVHPPDFDRSAIQPHAATLRTLFLDDFLEESRPLDDVEIDRTVDGLKAMLVDCTGLEQLAIRAPSPDAACPHPDYGTYAEFLECIKPLAKLRTLRLFIYLDKLKSPRGYRTSWLEPTSALRREATELYLQNLATGIFNTL